MQGTKGIWSKTARCALGVLCACALTAGSAAAAAPQITYTSVSAVTSSSATLEAEINPQGKATTYRFEYGTVDCEPGPCTSIPASGGSAGSGKDPVHREAKLKELTAATTYHFRVVAENSEGEVPSPDRTFTTSGPLAQTGLPDNRAYEQASPVDKNGGDAQGRITFTRSALAGGTITFGSAFGIPGGKGAQEIPTYLAKRGEGEAGWSTQGLLSPADTGQRAQPVGWLADFSKTFAFTTKLGNPDSRALLALPTGGGDPEVIAPYTPEAEYAYAGASKDSSQVVFESKAKLAPKAGQPPIPAALEGSSNVYVWDEADEELSLASVPNETGVPLENEKGAFAGPYDWGIGSSNVNLNNGGSARGYYTQDTHAVADDGSVYFTEAGTGQLYLRLNPTQPQSDMQGEKCIKPLDACTLHVSASKRTPSDPAGERPAAFMAASADGKEAFFTSSEELTDDANTGKEQAEASIGQADLDGDPESINAKIIPTHAVGVAVDGSHIYWAEPINGTIGRAGLVGGNVDPDSIEADFIAPGEVEFEVEKENEEGEIETETVIKPSKPRYLAVDAGHVYWTNTGRLDENGDAVKEGGTIGRAELDGEDVKNIEPAFIGGASDPQGIAVNASHIYWANSSRQAQTIGRAELDGDPDSVEQSFFETRGGGFLPYGVALSGGHVYFSQNQAGNGSIRRFPLEGGEEEFTGISDESELRGIATDATNVYWAEAAEDKEAIGRLAITDFGNSCGEAPSCKKELIKKEKLQGPPTGLAIDAAQIYWSVNGDSPPNPGNDLYRYRHEGEELDDLTPDEGDVNGAEVKGVIGASEDGSRLYFVANGDLDGPGGPAVPGDCKGALSSMSGSCNLYYWSGGESTLVARLSAGGRVLARNLVPSASELFFSGSYLVKTALVSADGRTLLFNSADRLTAYDNEGVPELYRYRAGDPEPLRCVSCVPSGEAADKGPSLGSVDFPKLLPKPPASVLARNMSAGGERVFFETTEALVPEDTNGQAGCPPVGSEGQAFPACLDVYEWEAPETGSCQPTAPGYSPQDGGCVYLISTGKSPYPSLFGDASASGDDVFFFTREGLVGQDKDELQDVYDARAGGGLAAQNPPPAPPPCEGIEGCHGPAPAVPAPAPTPASASFSGPGNAVPKHKKKAHKKKHKKKAHKKKAQHKKAKANRRAER